MSFVWLTPLKETLARFNLSQYLLLFCFVWASAASLGWKLDNLRLQEAKAETREQIEGRASDARLYRAAQAEYTAEALREKAEIERRDREREREANENYDVLLASYRDALRLRRESATRDENSRDNLPSPSGTPGSSPDEAKSPIVPPSEFLMISWEDADICSENTAKIITVYEWYADNR